jgi:hypothetical protein
MVTKRHLVGRVMISQITCVFLNNMVGVLTLTFTCCSVVSTVTTPVPMMKMLTDETLTINYLIGESAL